jgi:transposase
MPKRYSSEFRIRILDLLDQGRSVKELCETFDVSSSRVYAWKAQQRVDRGEVPGLTSVEQTELAAAQRRIRTLEAELAATKRANELLRQVVPPKGVTRPSK